MRTAVALPLALVVLALAFAQDTESDKSRIRALENAWNEAETNRDLKAVDALLADSFIYTDSDGTVMNKSAFLSSINIPSFEPEQIANNAMEIEIYSQTAVVTGAYTERGKTKGKVAVRRGRFTDVWVLAGGAWKCVASQETLITR
jgi:ketosteroid isomerase-like protein